MSKHLPLEEPDFFAETNIRANSSKQLSAHRGHIDCASNCSLLEVIEYLLRYHRSDSQLSLGRRSTQMRRGDYLIQRKERIIWCCRLLFEYIERSAGNFA